ncbi:elongation factor G [bacterium]|nr:elongation factor G [bacterium]
MNAKERLQKLRNLGIIAHIDAGKTTTTERILFFSGSSHKIGQVDDGTAIMDWMEQERERGITITSAVTSTTWRDHVLNIVDTPGHVDFTAEVQRSLRVLDGAVVVICGVGGVEPQSEKVWHQASEYRVPRIVFVNKLDRLGADFDAAIRDLEGKLDGTFVPLAIPLDANQGYPRTLDLMGNRVLRWEDGSEDDEPAEEPVGDDLRETLAAGRERIVEAAAEADEGILDAFLESGEMDTPRVIAALRKVVLSGRVHPVLSGTSLKNRGVKRLLEAIVDYLPSPLDVPPVEGIRAGTEDEVVRRNPNPDLPLTALVYKVMNDESRNRLYYTRIYSGRLKKGDKVWNSDRELEERVTRIYRMHSARKEALDEAICGDIVALVGPKRTATGDTLGTRDGALILEPIRFPEPVIAVAIEPRSQADMADLDKALAELAVEDPTFTVKDDPDTGQKIISGMGELHLQVIVERLSREFRVEARTGNPQVAYRESILEKARATGIFDREIADRPNRAEVTLELTPGKRNSGFVFSSALPDDAAPADALRWVAQAAEAATSSGPFAGYPFIDVIVQLTGVDLPGDAATEVAVRNATVDAFRKAANAASPVLLEPVVHAEVIVPAEYAGDVLKDLGSRHAHVDGMESRGKMEKASATVPLSRMFGYATDLRSITRGRGTFTMEISHFEPAEEAMARFRG